MTATPRPPAPGPRLPNPGTYEERDRRAAAPYTDEAIRLVVREWAKLERGDMPLTTQRVRLLAPLLVHALDQLLDEYRAGR